MEVSTLRMAWVPEARLQEALTEGLFVCIEEGTSKHATSHDDDVGDQTREGRAHHGNCLLFTGSSHDGTNTLFSVASHIGSAFEN